MRFTNPAHSDFEINCGGVLRTRVNWEKIFLPKSVLEKHIFDLILTDFQTALHKLDISLENAVFQKFGVIKNY